MTSDLALQAIGTIYETVLNPGGWPDALKALDECFGGFASCLISESGDGRLNAIMSPSGADVERDYQQWGAEFDILTARAIQQRYKPKGGLYVDTDLASAHEMTTHPFFTEMRSKHYIGWSAGGAVALVDQSVVAIVSQRPKDATAYTPSEMRLLTVIGSHVERALTLSTLLNRARAELHTSSQIIDWLEVGAFMLGAKGLVVEMNAAAIAMLGSGISISRGELSIADPEAQAAVNQVLATVRDAPERVATDFDKPIFIRRPDGKRPLIGYILPASCLGMPAIPWGVTKVVAVLTIVDPAQERTLDAAMVRDFLGLTLGEARLASLIATGVLLKDAATQLGITEETARTVLKRVFSKSGISKQSELVLLLSRLGLMGRKSPAG